MIDEIIRTEIIKIDDWYQKSFWPSVSVGLSEFEKHQFNVVSSYRNMLQQLAIVSGAIATFSLMLIPAKIKVSIVFLVSGVVILLLNTTISICYLFYSQRKDSKNLHILEDNKIVPAMHIRALYFKFLQDPTKDNLNGFKSGKEESLKILGNGQFDEYKKVHTDNSDIVLLGCFSLGMSLIILSILLPYIPC